METKKWFIYGEYSYAGAPKMEACMFGVAQKTYIGCLVKDEDLPCLVARLNETQDKLLSENKRLKKCEISLSSNDFGYYSDIKYLYIGHHHLVMKKVKEELNFEDEE